MLRATLWGLVLLATAIGPAQARNCADWLRGTQHVIRGMFVEAEGRSEDVFLFPLFIGAGRLAYVTCRTDEADRTSCRLGTVAGDRQTTADLAGCTGTASGRCPDFAAEGFSFGNAEAIATMLRHNRTRLCRAFPTGMRVEPLAPPKPGEASDARRYDRETHVEIVPDCRRIPRLPDSLRRACEDLAARNADDRPLLGMSLLRAGERLVVCAVRRDWTMAGCRGE